jgi:putative ABC transport system substrate-binding protein
VLEIRSVGEIDHALEVGVKAGSLALVQLSSPLLGGLSAAKQIAEAGGLMSYGPNQREYDKRLAVYIDKILKGAKPAELPIEQPTKFDFVINLKTAKMLGLTIPQSLRVQQVELIE